MRSSRRAGYRRHLDQNSCQWSDSRCARTRHLSKRPARKTLCQLQREVPMNEKVREHLAALNTAWQRYARAEEEPVDPITLDALNRDYLTAWEGLDACGIAEWMLVYDPETLTFSLPLLPSQS